MANRLFDRLLVGLMVGAAACGGENLTLPSEGEPANIRVFNGDQQNGLVGTELGTPLTVLVTDSKDRPVAGATVEFDFTQNGAQADPSSAVTGNDGQASTTLRLGTQVGPASGVARVPVPQGTVQVETTFTATALPANANIIALISGDNQQGPVNSTLGDPLVVQVTDGFGNPVAGETIQWAVTGGGTVSEATTQTDGSGRTSVTRTLGSEAGTQTTVASADGLAGSPVTFTHTATPGGASSILKISGDGQTAAAGSTLEVVVEVRDQNNNLVPAAPVTWVVGEGGGSVTPQSNSTDGAGRASAQWTLGPSSGSNTLNVVSIGATATFTATATGGSSGQVVKVSGDGQTGTAGAALGNPLVIQVFDAANNPVSGRSVTWFIGSGGGSTSPQTGSTDGQGMASTLWTLGATGTNTVTAVVAGIGNVSFTATANPGTPSATRSRISVSSNSVPVGGTVTITVRVRDANGNPIANVPVTISSSGTGNEISPASDNTAEDGIATFSFRSNVAESKIISATAGGVTINDTKTINVFRRSSTIRITSDAPDPSEPGQTIHVTFEVSGDGGTPTGTVEVFSLEESGGCAAAPVGPNGQGFCDFAFALEGTHRIEATYSGDSQFEDAAAAAVNHDVQSPPPTNQDPTAAFTAPTGCTAGTACLFDGSASTDDVSVSTWTWDFGDPSSLDNIGSGSTASHTYALPNTYSVTLTVTDNLGATNSVTHDVVVQ